MTRVLRRYLHLLRADRRGVSALEFVLVMPLIVLIMLATADLGNAVQQSIRLETAARAGAQYAFTFPRDAAGIRNQVLSTLSGWTDVTVPNPTLVCRCPSNTSVTCANEDTCTQPTERFISIRATRPFSAVVMPNLSIVEGRAEVRVR